MIPRKFKLFFGNILEHPKSTNHKNVKPNNIKAKTCKKSNKLLNPTTP